MNLDKDFILDQLRKKINLDMDKVDQIYIYGSFGENKKKVKPDSDIDVMVILDKYYEEEVIEYDGLNPVEIIVKSEEENYGKRKVDLGIGGPNYEEYKEDIPLL